MKLFFQLNVIVFLYIELIYCQKNKNDDEGRPYEFGFTIDGEQHRHEKKDVNGIIQGEFGFITADGVYHVTVYATDENGNFRILSMRNIKISDPLDGSGPAKSQKLVDTKPNKVQQIEKTTKSSIISYPFTTQPTIKPACAGCGYVTTLKPQPGENKFPGFRNQNQNPNTNNNQVRPQQFTYPNPEVNQQNPSVQSQIPSLNQNVQINNNNNDYDNQATINPLSLSTPNQDLDPPINSNQPLLDNTNSNSKFNNFAPSGSFNKIPADKISSINNPAVFTNNNNSANPKTPPNSNNLSPSGSFNKIPANKISSINNPALFSIDNNPSNPKTSLSQVSVSNGAIHIPGKSDIPIKDKYPGMVDGLPSGIEENDVKDILYKFNYTVGFHGHYEKGLKNGAKVGGYFVNGRDGISRIVTYVADENGYRPKVKFLRLGLDSPDTPKEETEKSFGLKNFEFIWYPVD